MNVGSVGRRDGEMIRWQEDLGKHLLGMFLNILHFLFITC